MIIFVKIKKGALINIAQLFEILKACCLIFV